MGICSGCRDSQGKGEGVRAAISMRGNGRGKNKIETQMNGAGGMDNACRVEEGDKVKILHTRHSKGRFTPGKKRVENI